MPVLFLLLWSSGIFFLKVGLNYAPPFALLSLRLLFSALVLTTIAGLLRSRWPSWKEIGHLSITSFFSQVLYAGGLILALTQQVSPGLIILIVGAQPALTAIISIFLFKESTTPSVWIGLFLGFFGLGFVVLNPLLTGIISAAGAALSLLALIGITVGTVLQKRLCSQMDLFTGTAIQSWAGSMIFALLAFSFESLNIRWELPLFVVICYLAFGISVGALYLLYSMIKRGKLIQVTSIFYFVPPLTAIMDFLILGNKLSGTVLIGMAIIIMGIILINLSDLREFLSPRFKKIS